MFTEGISGIGPFPQLGVHWLDGVTLDLPHNRQFIVPLAFYQGPNFYGHFDVIRHCVRRKDILSILWKHVEGEKKQQESRYLT